MLLDFHVKTGTRFSLRDKRLLEISKVEIMRVNCINEDTQEMPFSQSTAFPSTVRRRDMEQTMTKHSLFSTVIISLPLIQEGQLSVSDKRMCTILINCLEDQACPVKVRFGKLTALDMTHGLTGP